jgi:hypothetical protein
MFHGYESRPAVAARLPHAGRALVFWLLGPPTPAAARQPSGLRPAGVRAGVGHPGGPGNVGWSCFVH